MRWFGIVALVVVLGCARRDAPVLVSGTVTVDGEPLKEGQIRFSRSGEVPVSIDIVDGKYQGMIKPGEQRVELAAYRPYRIPPEVPKSMHSLMEGGKENYLPAKYHNESDQTALVKADAINEFHFDVKTK